MKRDKLTLYIWKHRVKIFSEKEMERTVYPTYYQWNKFENILTICCSWTSECKSIKTLIGGIHAKFMREGKLEKGLQNGTEGEYGKNIHFICNMLVLICKNSFKDGKLALQIFGLWVSIVT